MEFVRGYKLRCRVFANVFKEKLWFGEFKIIRNSGARALFEEAVEDDEE
jgi:hypothetical protein